MYEFGMVTFFFGELMGTMMYDASLETNKSKILKNKIIEYSIFKSQPSRQE